MYVTQVIMGNSYCISGRSSLLCVCWVSFGAWLLSRSNNDCIRLANFRPLLRVEIGKGSPSNMYLLECSHMVNGLPKLLS